MSKAKKSKTRKKNPVERFLLIWYPRRPTYDQKKTQQEVPNNKQNQKKRYVYCSRYLLLLLKICLFCCVCLFLYYYVSFIASESENIQHE